MVSKSGGGRRGRPAVLTPEQKIQRERERWRRKQAAKRKREADARWLQATDFGYFDHVEVIHWNQFVEFLVYSGRLDEIDAETQSRIDRAADVLLLDYVEDRTADYGHSPFSCYHGPYGPNPNFRGLPSNGINRVRVKVTMPLVELLGLENECDNRPKIRRAIEELLFLLYSEIADRSLPTQWPTTGRDLLPPLWQTTQTHQSEYLRAIGMLGGRSGTRFRQDMWLDPKDHDTRRSGAMYDGGGRLEGRRRRSLPGADSDRDD